MLAAGDDGGDGLRRAGRGDALAQEAARRAGDAHGQTRLRIERRSAVNSLSGAVVGEVLARGRCKPSSDRLTRSTLEIFLPFAQLRKPRQKVADG